MAAGGAVNPVVLRRDVPSWRASELMALSRAFYVAWQERSAISCLHPVPLVKIFPTPNEVRQWARAMVEPATAPFITSRSEPEIDVAPLRAPYGYGTVTDAFWLDLPMLLHTQREELLLSAQLTERDVDRTEVRSLTDGVRIGDVKGRWLIRCTGPFSSDECVIPVKGETLTVRIPGLHLTRMVHGAVGLLPMGEELYRVGSTFKWTDVWSGPTEDARHSLLEKLETFVKVPVEVVAQHAGVRPTTRDRRPILGTEAAHEAVFNGLGTRGVLLAPWCAEHLLDHLFEGKKLDPEVDRQRFA